MRGRAVSKKHDATLSKFLLKAKQGVIHFLEWFNIGHGLPWQSFRIA